MLPSCGFYGLRHPDVILCISDMDPIQDLYTFVETTRRGMDTQTSNIFAASCGRWLRYYLFLQIIRARFAQESEAYTTEIYQYTERIQRSLSSGPRNMAPEEWQELQHIQSLEQLIHLEIESFYTFAKILLDRIADTFSYFYSVPLRKKDHHTRNSPPSLKASVLIAGPWLSHLIC